MLQRLTPALQRVLFFEPDPGTSTELVQNPLFIEFFPPFFRDVAPKRVQWPNARSIASMPWSKAPDAFKRSEASWRRMLVTQPPPLRLIVTSRSDGRGGASQRRGIMNDPCLRMGTLYDFVLPCVNQYASSFCVRWCEDTPSEDGERDFPHCRFHNAV
ncbi:hypothetical protein K438DRAFT_1973370 [Mycena galopus ATCC 62051]|nr:hypothetical protein K438DRAFT_1973370 [Mycena galopus ATCC 62051]